MSEDRVIKKLYMSKPEGRRNVGRPKMRWLDDVEEDVRFQVLTAASMMFRAVFWVVLPCK
jgi:hypothetical protein